MYRSAFIFLLMVFFSFSVQGQGNYVMKNFSDVDGLPQNSIKSIAPDESGYLWLATEDGLTRYDGYNFLLYDKFNTRYPSKRMNSLKRSLKTGALYAETESHELIQIKKGTTLLKSEPFKNIFPYAQDPEFLMAESPLKYKNSPLFKIDISFNERCEIKKNKIIYYHLENRKEIEYKYSHTALFFVSKRQLFHINTNTSVDLIDAKGITKIPLTGPLTDEKNASESTLKIYWNNANDQVFVYINKSVYQLQYNGKVLISKLMLTDLDLGEKNIITIYYNQRSKKFFLGSLTQGLYTIQLPAFNSKMAKGQIDRSVKYALFPYNDHTVLFANGSLLQTDGKESQLPLLNSYSNNFSITIDRQKNIWVQKDFSVFKLSEDGRKLLEKHTFPTEASCLYLEKDSLLWIGTLGGIYTLDPAKPKSIPQELLKIKNVSILKKQGDNLWIGAYKGLFRYNIKEKSLSVISKMSNYHIRDILIRKDEVWICTYGNGFYLYKENKLKKMPLDNGKYLNNSHCLVEDKKGFFWITTNKGLFQVDIKDLLAFNRGAKDNVYFNYFNQDYGFNINEFNGGCQPCGVVLNDGNLVFPSLIGSVMFDPNQLQSELPDQPIYIDKIFRDNQEIKSSDTLTINPDFERLNILISTPYFGNRYNLQFEYKLKEENNWIQLDPTASISFSTLSSGTHELIIRKPSGFGQSYSYKSLIINVSPKFYQTWWFIVFTLVIITLLIFLISKHRTSRILKRNKMLEELVLERTHELANNINNLKDSQNQLQAQSIFQKRLLAAITHDIKSPLRYMMITGKQLYVNQKQSPNLKEVTRAVYLSARNMFYFTENLLNYSKLFLNDTQQRLTRLDLSKLITEKIEIFSDAALYNKISFKNQVGEETFINTNELILSVIIHNLLDNAVKYSPGGSVIFSVINIEKSLILVITDEGPGLPTEIIKWLNAKNSREVSDGLGLKMIKELAPKINLIVIAERLVKGTRYELRFNEID